MSGSASGSGFGSRESGRGRAGAGRVARAWRTLPHERRLAAGAALGLFLTLFLPWYQETVIVSASSRTAELRLASASLTGWGAFSFVEAAVLLVAAAVLVLLFFRAEGRAFHVPGGDGGVITAAGLWTCVLILWRIFDKEGGPSNHGQYLTTSGIEWGIFIALGVAGFLAYSGSRIRIAHEPEPPLPGESRPPGAAAGAETAVTVARRRRPRRLDAGGAGGAGAAGSGAGGARAPGARAAGAGGAGAGGAGAGGSAGASDRARRDGAERRNSLGLPDLTEIEFEDPPTARLGRSQPAPARRPREPLVTEDEQLTTRLDQRSD